VENKFLKNSLAGFAAAAVLSLGLSGCAGSPVHETGRTGLPDHFYCYGLKCLYPYVGGMETIPDAQKSYNDPRCRAPLCYWVEGRSLEKWTPYLAVK